MADSIYESGEYLAHNPDWHQADAPYKARWIADILKQGSLQPDHIVDIGCGSGQILVELSRHLPDTRFDGYDISPQAYAIAAPKASGNLAFHQADYLALEPDHPDVLMAIDVFEHVEDYMAFLRAMRLRAQYKIFHIPLDLSVQGLLRGTGLMKTRRKIGHLHYFCKDTALATLTDCGYEIICWNYTHGTQERPNKRIRTRALNLPRRVIRAIDEDLSVRLMGGSSIMVLSR